MRKRIVLIGVNLAIVLAVVGGTIAYASMSKTVSLSIDGKAQEVRTFGSDVGDVLEQEGIDVGEHDVVAPDVDSEIDEGTSIAVRYGRELTVTKDGVTRTYWVTATNVADALAQLDMRVVDSAELSASRGAEISRSGMRLTITTPKKITLVVGDNTQRTKTTAKTVGEALTEAEVKLNKHDRLALRMNGERGTKQRTAKTADGSQDKRDGATNKRDQTTKHSGDRRKRSDRTSRPGATPRNSRAMDQTVVEGMRIVVTRISIGTETAKVSVPYRTIVRENDNLLEGKVRTKREGVEGVKKVTYRVRRVNGDVRQREVVKSVRLSKPRAQIEVHGTKQPEEVDPPPDYSGGGTVWDELAECESGGDWSINTGNGYYGGLQFNYETWHAYGGGAYAEYPHQASREEQIAIAVKLRDANGGYGAWPACAAELGLPT